MTLKVAAAFVILIASLSCSTAKKSEPDLLKPRASPIQVGENAPDFSLIDQNKQSASLSSARGKMPVVLVFYRGHW